MRSRKDYLGGEISHREYYAQFVSDEVRGCVKHLLPELIASEDEHFNDIPLRVWDSLYLPRMGSKLRECGDYLTKAGRVCILKEAARQVLETP